MSKKSPKSKKVYKVTFAEIEDGEEWLNATHKNVLAVDVLDAIKKSNVGSGYFVQSVEFVMAIND